MSGRGDDIGYSKPPPWSRFKPGQSGNPAGRPPKTKKTPEKPTALNEENVDAHLAMLRDEYYREVIIQENGKPKKLSMATVVTKAQLNAAAKGNAMAQREVMKQTREIAPMTKE